MSASPAPSTSLAPTADIDVHLKHDEELDGMNDPQSAVDSSLQQVTIVVPALNEEGLVRQTVEEVLPIARQFLHSFEIVLVNDGSTDGTGAIMDELAQAHDEIHVIHHEHNCGLAFTFRETLAAANYRHLTIVPGDHSYHAEGLGRLFQVAGTRDLVLGYRQNLAEVVPFSRLLSSKIVLLSMWPLLGTMVKDVHGPGVYPVTLLRQLDLRAEGFAFCIEALVKLFKRGVTLAQVPVQLNPSTVDNTSALQPTTVMHMARTWLQLLMWRLRRDKNTQA